MKIKVGRYEIELSNQDKVLFGKSGITKGDLVNYYIAIAPTIMPYVKNRLISMQRFPNGIHHEGFFQKDASDYFPDWITRYPIMQQVKDGVSNREPGDHCGKKEGLVNYVVIDKPATLVYLANQANIPLHTWLSCADKVDKPDRIVFDLDPANASDFPKVQWAAKQLKAVLDDLGLPSFFMLTGSRGAHVVIPIKRLYTFDETRSFAHDVAQLLSENFPKELTITMQKKERKKRIFIDWLRNGFGATGIAPYAVRPLEEAPVAMPVTWNELCKKGMSSQKYNINNVANRMRTVGDVWNGMSKHAASLTTARKRLARMLEHMG